MLSARQRLLGSLLSPIDGLELEKFGDRLLLQKRIFLLQMSGVDLGYRFSWYLRGPYSPTLTQDAFAIDDERRSGGAVPTAALPAVVQDTVAALRSRFRENWNDPEAMELAASLVFLSLAHGETDPTALRKHLTELKPSRFATDRVDRATIWLTKQGLLNG